MMMPVFEPGSSSVESNRSANWAKNPLQRHKQILLIWWQIKRDDWSILCVTKVSTDKTLKRICLKTTEGGNNDDATIWFGCLWRKRRLGNIVRTYCCCLTLTLEKLCNQLYSVGRAVTSKTEIQLHMCYRWKAKTNF